MTNKRARQTLSSISLAIILFFACTIGVRTFTRQILIKHMGVTNLFTDLVLFDVKKLNNSEKDNNDINDDETNDSSVVINWKKLYPFSESKNHIFQETASNVRQSKISKFKYNYELQIELLKNKIDVYTTDFLIGYNKIVELTKRYENLMQWNYMTYIEYNGIIKQYDGYLVSYVIKIDVSEPVKSTVNFVQYCRKNNIDLIYVQAPSKICKYEDKKISGVLDFSNQNIDSFLNDLKTFEIDTIDLRKTLHDENLSHHELFYKTDHHWKGESGLWASRHILKKLKNDYKFDIDLSLLDNENFKKVIYPKWFLGTQGKKVTLEQAKPDDFSLLYPRYLTNFHYEIPNIDINQDGDFSILYNMLQVNDKDYYGKDPYGAYIYANQPFERIENKQIKENGHILILHDSYGCCVIPFIALGLKHVDLIDLRYFTGSIHSYIEKEKPNVIIIIYSSNTISYSQKIDWSNNKHLFDFR